MSAHTSTIVDSTADDPIIDMTWHQAATPKERARAGLDARERAPQIGRASCRDRVYVLV